MENHWFYAKWVEMYEKYWFHRHLASLSFFVKIIGFQTKLSFRGLRERRDRDRHTHTYQWFGGGGEGGGGGADGMYDECLCQ